MLARSVKALATAESTYRRVGVLDLLVGDVWMSIGFVPTGVEAVMPLEVTVSSVPPRGTGEFEKAGWMRPSPAGFDVRFEVLI